MENGIGVSALVHEGDDRPLAMARRAGSIAHRGTPARQATAQGLVWGSNGERALGQDRKMPYSVSLRSKRSFLRSSIVSSATGMPSSSS